MQSDAVPQCIACRSTAPLPSLCEERRDVVHPPWNGWGMYYSICGACIRLSWRDATELEGVCQSWEEVDDTAHGTLPLGPNMDAVDPFGPTGYPMDPMCNDMLGNSSVLYIGKHVGHGICFTYPVSHAFVSLS